MTTNPETIMSDELKVYRGQAQVTTDEIAANIMTKLAREGWKFLHVNGASEEVLAQAGGITKKQYLQLFTALRDQ